MNQLQPNQFPLTTLNVDLQCGNLVINVHNGVIPGAGGIGGAGVAGAVGGELGGGEGGAVAGGGHGGAADGGAGGGVAEGGQWSALALVLSANTLVFNIQNFGVPVVIGPGPGPNGGGLGVGVEGGQVQGQDPLLAPDGNEAVNNNPLVNDQDEDGVHMQNKRRRRRRLIIEDESD